MKQTAFLRGKNGEYIPCLNIQYLYLLNKYKNVNNTGTNYVRIMKQTAF